MEKNKVDNLAKKVVYLFKKFARKNNFWEEYKALSSQLNVKFQPKTFIQIVEENEPVKLIQNAFVFCCWPSSCTRNGKEWAILSAEWAKICIKENLYWDRKRCYFYVDCNIQMSKEEKYKLLGDYYNKF